jgi:hypothetical protein
MMVDSLASFSIIRYSLRGLSAWSVLLGSVDGKMVPISIEVLRLGDDIISLSSSLVVVRFCWKVMRLFGGCAVVCYG